MNKLTTHKQLRNKLISKQDFKITSLEITEISGQRHDHTLEMIRKRLDSQHYRESYYLNSQNKKQTLYLLTEKGFFIFLSKNRKGGDIVMGRALDMISELRDSYNTHKEWKNEREKLKAGTRAKTDLIKANYESEKKKKCPYFVYSNFENLQMKKVIGYSSTQVIDYIAVNCNIPRHKINARDYLKTEYLKALKNMEATVTVLITSGHSYKDINKIIKSPTNIKPIVEYLNLDRLLTI